MLCSSRCLFFGTLENGRSDCSVKVVQAQSTSSIGSGTLGARLSASPLALALPGRNTKGPPPSGAHAGLWHTQSWSLGAICQWPVTPGVSRGHQGPCLDPGSCSTRTTGSTVARLRVSPNSHWRVHSDIADHSAGVNWSLASKSAFISGARTTPPVGP